MSESNNVFLNIELNEEGNLKLDTNLGDLGAIHLMADATKIILSKAFEASQEMAEEEETPKEESN